MTHEMVEMLARLDLTAREHKVVWGLIRYLQGWQMKERVIKTKNLLKITGMRKDHLSETVKSLMAKGIIQRLDIDPKVGLYSYRFHEENFVRTHATEVIRIDKKLLKLVPRQVPESGTHEFPKQVPSGTRNMDPQVPKSGTTDGRIVAPIAAFEGPKDTLKDKNKENLKEKLKESFTPFGKRELTEKELIEKKERLLREYRESEERLSVAIR